MPKLWKGGKQIYPYLSQQRVRFTDFWWRSKSMISQRSLSLWIMARTSYCSMTITKPCIKLLFFNTDVTIFLGRDPGFNCPSRLSRCFLRLLLHVYYKLKVHCTSKIVVLGTGKNYVVDCLNWSLYSNFLNVILDADKCLRTVELILVISQRFEQVRTTWVQV